MARIKLKKLEEYLQGLDDFESPKIQLEQYITPPHIASNILYTIQSNFDDIEGKIVADLGCGSGMLAIGAFILGAAHVVGFEIDDGAIDVLRTNLDDMEIENVDVVQCDVTKLTCESNKIFDTVLLNPPFGTKNNAGMDMKFLLVAISLTNGAVYSLHKSSTRDFIKKKAGEWGLESQVVAELRYDLPSSYKFHKKDSKDIAVDFWRFEVKK
ncbi:rRNA N6-adenosine-methyltransferase Mettl5 [Culicoides brevitarsis]|uniref:rRNA N6-adenosine-methyltransferase Mettl5 n=1 Tax=Culicoides brevitarsis TaxID=469753 RepID=UPI00307C8290